MSFVRNDVMIYSGQSTLISCLFTRFKWIPLPYLFNCLICDKTFSIWYFNALHFYSFLKGNFYMIRIIFHLSFIQARKSHGNALSPFLLSQHNSYEYWCNLGHLVFYCTIAISTVKLFRSSEREAGNSTLWSLAIFPFTCFLTFPFSLFHLLSLRDSVSPIPFALVSPLSPRSLSTFLLTFTRSSSWKCTHFFPHSHVMKGIHLQLNRGKKGRGGGKYSAHKQ